MKAIQEQKQQKLEQAENNVKNEEDRVSKEKLEREKALREVLDKAIPVNFLKFLLKAFFA